MEEHGYVVIADVASREEIERAKQLFWDHAEHAAYEMDVTTPERAHCLIRPKLKRGDPSTFIDENWIGDPTTGIVYSYGIGQVCKKSLIYTSFESIHPAPMALSTECIRMVYSILAQSSPSIRGSLARKEDDRFF